MIDFGIVEAWISRENVPCKVLKNEPWMQVTDPNEIKAIFDTISYKKGASIMHMLESTVGEVVVRAGLTKYLNSHKFGTAVTDDLWQAVEEAWARLNRKFDLLYAKRAFVHW